MKPVVGMGIVILLVFGGVWLWVYGPGRDYREVTPGGSGAETVFYRNAVYGFSFGVPQGQEVYEYIPEFVAVGQPIEGGFDADTEVVVAKSSDERNYRDFEEFLTESVRTMCAADGPNATQYCTQLTRQEPFESDSGLSGTRFYAVRIYENLATGEKREEQFGPFVAFNIQANTPDVIFSALIIRPAISKSAAEAALSLVAEIANTVYIEITNT